jgi:hypothetical protein
MNGSGLNLSGARAASTLTAAAFFALATTGTATAEAPNRYPYDPACAWGRLADGHGMLIRCLDPGEATALLERALSGSGSGSAGGSGPAPADSKADDHKSVEAVGPAREPSNQQLSVTAVGPAVADAGELPLAEKKLGLPKDRYVDCVRKNGGLTADTGKVVVRFLVRERGRAEGVSVKSRQGMSQAAAACIADVVDRRYVGYPAAPIVGATIPIELSIRR